MNISLPEPLKIFVDERVANAGYGTSSEYLRELIRRDQDRLKLRNLILEGAKVQVMGEADAQYFSNLRNQASKSSTQQKQ